MRQNPVMASAPPPIAFLRPLALGIVTGLRSQLGLAALAWSAPARRSDPTVLRKLRTPVGLAALSLAAGGELVVDKLPKTLSRVSPPALGGRLVAGAAVGALAMGKADRKTTVLAATTGVLGAAAGSYGGAAFRKVLPARTQTPDLPWALGEDAAAVGLAVAATRRQTAL